MKTKEEKNNIMPAKAKTGAKKASQRVKITKGINRVTTTHTEMGRALKISRQRVSQLVQSGLLPVDENGEVLLVAGIKAYCHARTGMEVDDDINFDKERALHEKAKREIAELKLAKMQGSVYSARVVELVMTEMASNLRTQLLGLPSKMAPILEGKTKEEIYTQMTKEIEEKLSELAEYKPDLFIDDVLEEEDSDEESK